MLSSKRWTRVLWVAAQDDALASIKAHFYRHTRFREIYVDKAGGDIALTGEVFCHHFRNQAVQYSTRVWASILNHVEVLMTRFIVWSLIKHLVLLSAFWLGIHLGEALFHGVALLAFLDEWGVNLLAGVFALDFLAEVTNEIRWRMHALRQDLRPH